MIWLIVTRRLHAPMAVDDGQGADNGLIPVMVNRRVRRWRSAQFRFRRGPN